MIRGLLGLIALLVVAAAGSAVAQDDAQGPSYITPFPDNDTYRLSVIGDWYAEGLVNGLFEGFDREVRLQIQRKHRAFHGLARSEFEEDLAQLDEQLARETLHIAIVMLGGNDRVAIRPPSGGRRLPFGTEDWRAQYAGRVDRMMKLFKRRNVAVYWAGLPPLRRSEANDEAQVLNEIYRERALANGLRFVDVYEGFLDDQGAYNAYGPDLFGKSRLLRSNDGYSFTDAGYKKLAHFVERDIKRDLTRAKNDRAIPLAGGEAEQRKINPARVAAAAAVVPAAKGAARSGAPAAGQAAGAQVAAPAQGAGGEQKADNSRIALRTIAANGREETVQVEILRPAISASVLALIQRRDSGEKASQVGDQVIEAMPGGLLVLSSMTSATERGAAGLRRAAPTQTPYFRVLVRGERLPPKPGRADDHAWPRAEPEPESKATPAVAPGKAAPAPATPARAPPRSPRS
jgi:hypothetical protein